MNYTTVIADDEPLVRARIEGLLERHPAFRVVARCRRGEEVIAAVREYRPDLLLLDINMPGGGGFAALRELGGVAPLVIFITAYEQYALKAFEYAAFDYLLKPISTSRFRKTMARARDHLRRQSREPGLMLAVPTEGKIEMLEAHRISHLEAADNYVLLHYGSTVYRKRATFSEMLVRLAPVGFIRIHRSYALNPRFISSIARIYNGDFLVRLANGRVIPSSRSYRAALKKLAE